MNAEIESMRARIAVTGRMMYERWLTDTAGGNISARVGDLIVITARYSGSKQRWQLTPEQVLVSDLNGNKLEGQGEISREAKAHFRIYQEFPEAGAVVHGHARNALVFACAGQPIPPVLEDTAKFGVVKVTGFGPSHSATLADAVVEAIRGQEARIRQYAAVVLAPWHGVFAAGRDLDAAFDAVERTDTNARCLLLSRLLPVTEGWNSDSMSQELERALVDYHDRQPDPNPGIDYSLRVKEFRLNATIRAEACAWGMGGKATDASWILAKLGVPSLALGFAAGANGRRMETMLRERGVRTEFVQAVGETRLNVVVCSEAGQSTLTAPGVDVNAAQLVLLEERYEHALEAAECVILGGSLPKGVPVDFFAGAIRKAGERGIPVLFDSSGEVLKAGITARPSLVKPNREELACLAGKEISTFEEAARAAMQIKDTYGCDVIATLGEDGAAAILGETAWRVHPCPVQVVSTAGAGDGVLAGMALAMSRGEPPKDGLRHGFALAAAIAQTLATADFEMADYEHFLGLVQIEEFSVNQNAIASGLEV